jgi:hypothetical protein
MGMGVDAGGIIMMEVLDVTDTTGMDTGMDMMGMALAISMHWGTNMIIMVPGSITTTTSTTTSSTSSTSSSRVCTAVVAERLSSKDTGGRARTITRATGMIKTTGISLTMIPRPHPHPHTPMDADMRMHMHTSLPSPIPLYLTPQTTITTHPTLLNIHPPAIPLMPLHLLHMELR